MTREALPRWWPVPLQVSGAERWRAALGAALGLLAAGLLCRWAGLGADQPWLVAPLGASAVLVFAVPSSPMARPWAVVGGNTLSALVGIACARWVGDPAWAGALAVGAAIGLMFALRCLHPPGGAMALLTALGGVTAFEFAAFPALANSLALVAFGLGYNRATRGPARPLPVHADDAAATASRFTRADLDAVLARRDEVLDVSRDDLEALLHAAEGQAWRRRLGALRCADVMSRSVFTASFGTTLADAWALMRQHRIKALPVVDGAERVIGIVTRADFLTHARIDADAPGAWSARFGSFLRASGSSHSDKPEAVGQIMTRRVRVVSAERPVAELLPLFAAHGHHHIPVVGVGARLVGIVTQSDLVAALAQPD